MWKAKSNCDSFFLRKVGVFFSIINKYFFLALRQLNKTYNFDDHLTDYQNIIHSAISALNYLLCSHAKVSYCLVLLERVKQCSQKQLLLKLVQTSLTFLCQVLHLRLNLYPPLLYFDLTFISLLGISSHVLALFFFFCFSGLVRVRNMWKLFSLWRVKFLLVLYLLMR